jgi:hypothetical protein
MRGIAPIASMLIIASTRASWTGCPSRSRTTTVIVFSPVRAGSGEFHTPTRYSPATSNLRPGGTEAVFQGASRNSNVATVTGRSTTRVVSVRFVMASPFMSDGSTALAFEFGFGLCESPAPGASVGRAASRAADSTP